MKYTQEIKDKAVAMAKSGIHLKVIQTQLGPNPKATERYMKKAGFDYKKFLADQKAKNAVPSITKEQKATVKAK